VEVKFHILFLIQHYMELNIKLHAAGALTLAAEKYPQTQLIRSQERPRSIINVVMKSTFIKPLPGTEP
jgi:hypothetical protein